MAETEKDSAAYEVEHVHNVYEQISSHFSSTRYKPWPIVSEFLTNLAPGSIGLDVGCGNGKYLSVNRDIFILASDRSTNLLQHAASVNSNTTTSPTPTTPSKTRTTPPAHTALLLADTLSLPHPRSTFDFAICIAVLHHLSTPARRVAALRDILETLRPPTAATATAVPAAASPLPASTPPTSPPPTSPPAVAVSVPASSPLGPTTPATTTTAAATTTTKPAGRALLFVWALEQRGSRRGWGAGDAQDVMVPWVMGGGAGAAPGPVGGGTGRERRAGRKKGTRGTKGGEDDVEDAEQAEERTEKEEEATTTMTTPTTFQRYYHLYRAGELEADVEAAGGRVVQAGYERDNWWVIAERALS